MSLLTPDMLPKSLRSLDWQPCSEDLRWRDGDTYLMAVGVCDDNDTTEWHYEFAVVTIRCDEHYFELEVEGEQWGWDITCVDWFVKIS